MGHVIFYRMAAKIGIFKYMRTWARAETMSRPYPLLNPLMPGGNKKATHT